MNPSVISFIENLNPLFVLIISIIFLKEKISLLEVVGGFITLSGVLLLTFSYIEGKLYLIFLTVFDIFIYSVNATVIRSQRKKISPIYLATLRIYTIFIFFAIESLLRSNITIPDGKTLLLLVAGGTVGPFMGMYLYFKSLQYLKVSTVSFINRIKPFLVFLGTGLLLGYETGGKILLSGILIVVGSIILIVGGKNQLKTE